MQKAKRSSIQSTRHSSSAKTFQSFQAFQSFQTFQSFMTFQPYKHLYTFQHLPVRQYLPVLSSVSRDSTHSSISLIRMHILHTDWFPPETPLSTNRIQDILQTLHSSKKGRCCDIGHTFDIFYRIELRVKELRARSK